MSTLTTRTMSGSFTLILVIFALAALGVLVDAASAATITLNGTYSRDHIKKACENAGSASYGTGLKKGAYGCDADGGSVNCNNSGKCTGTCGKCGTRETPGDIMGVLRPPGGMAPSKSTPATDPKGKAGVGKGDVKQPGSGSQQK